MPEAARIRFALILTLVVAACAPFHRSAVDPELPNRGEPAKLFAPGIVSTGDVFASTFTPDGRTVVFTKVALPRMWLMESRLEDGRWSAPTMLPFSGEWRDLDAAFSPDGSRLYFSSWRPTPGSPRDTSNLADTWYVARTAAGWGTPTRVEGPANTNFVEMYPSLTRSGALYFDSGRSGKREVYRSAATGTGAAELLGAAINGTTGASNFFIDPDERYAIFGARRDGGRGEMDLYVSWRRNGDWTPPRNLGPRVNSESTDFCPFVSADGRFLYFTRLTPTGVNPVVRNVYVVRIDDLLEQLAAAP